MAEETATRSSNPESTISMIVVDDQGLVRDGISGLLSRENDFRVLAVAENAEEAITKATEHQPDIVVFDIEMPGMSCFDAIDIIRVRSPRTRYVICTSFDHDTHIENALKFKIGGFVSKTAGIADLVEAIHRVATGRVHFSPEIMKRLVFEGDVIKLKEPPKSRLSSLTRREHELLRVLAKGLSLKEAAAVFGISYKTADKQKSSLMSKLDIHDRVELARYAIREGLVEP